MYEPFFKLLPDLFIGLTGFIILLPTFLVVGIALLIANDGKIFFLQLRPGVNEKIFNPHCGRITAGAGNKNLRRI